MISRRAVFRQNYTYLVFLFLQPVILIYSFTYIQKDPLRQLIRSMLAVAKDDKRKYSTMNSINFRMIFWRRPLQLVVVWSQLYRQYYILIWYLQSNIQACIWSRSGKGMKDKGWNCFHTIVQIDMMVLALPSTYPQTDLFSLNHHFVLSPIVVVCDFVDDFVPDCQKRGAIRQTTKSTITYSKFTFIFWYSG